MPRIVFLIAASFSYIASHSHHTIHCVVVFTEMQFAVRTCDQIMCASEPSAEPLQPVLCRTTADSP